MKWLLHILVTSVAFVCVCVKFKVPRLSVGRESWYPLFGHALNFPEIWKIGNQITPQVESKEKETNEC